MEQIQEIEFPCLGDDRGLLVALEQGMIPFSIKRVYYLFDTKENVSRGYHAHKKLRQMAVCIKGSCRFVFDNGFQREEKILRGGNKGVFIGSMVWREMHDFSEDCVLLVLADAPYMESDYIRDYQEFITEVHNNAK